MSNKRTLKALEELVKTEHMAIGALDAASEDVEDSKLRKQYRKWRDSHMKQADALNERIEDLGGEPIEYEAGSGKGQGGLWGKISSMRDDTSIEGMRIGAERGIKRYVDNIDDVEDPKALSIIRRNLESKQDEMRWYDDQAQKEREKTLDTKVTATREKVAVQEEGDGGKKKGGGLPFPLLLLVGGLGAAAYFLLKRGDDSEFDDYGEDAFEYDAESSTSSTSDTSGSNDYMAGSTEMADYSASTSHGSNGG